MVVGFLKGVWGKPAEPATGFHGLWDTVTKAPKSIFDAILTPIKLIKWIIVIIVGLIVYKRFVK